MKKCKMIELTMNKGESQSKLFIIYAPDRVYKIYHLKCANSFIDILCIYFLDIFFTRVKLTVSG